MAHGRGHNSNQWIHPYLNSSYLKFIKSPNSSKPKSIETWIIHQTAEFVKQSNTPNNWNLVPRGYTYPITLCVRMVHVRLHPEILRQCAERFISTADRLVDRTSAASSSGSTFSTADLCACNYSWKQQPLKISVVPSRGAPANFRISPTNRSSAKIE